MNDPVTLGLAGTAVGLVNSTIGLLKEAREAAKRSEDNDLKDKLSEIFDAVLELKEVVGNLREENADLRKRIETRTRLAWNGELKVYLAEGDPDPYCPSCMDLNERRIRLHPTSHPQDAFWKYRCNVCKNYFVREE
jgi:hypothetical protein